MYTYFQFVVCPGAVVTSTNGSIEMTLRIDHKRQPGERTVAGDADAGAGLPVFHPDVVALGVLAVTLELERDALLAGERLRVRDLVAANRRRTRDRAVSAPESETA